MSTASHQLPMPAGARVASPRAAASRRARVERWAAPDPAALILDPWAPPVGVRLASNESSPWSAPIATARVGWMPAPVALFPPPDGFVSSTEVAASTERAIATLRTLAALPAPRGLPVPVAGARLTAVDSTRALPAPDPATFVAAPAPGRASEVRWRVVAIATGIGAAVAAGVSLLAVLL